MRDSKRFGRSISAFDYQRSFLLSLHPTPSTLTNCGPTIDQGDEKKTMQREIWSEWREDRRPIIGGQWQVKNSRRLSKSSSPSFVQTNVSNSRACTVGSVQISGVFDSLSRFEGETMRMKMINYRVSTSWKTIDCIHVARTWLFFEPRERRGRMEPNGRRKSTRWRCRSPAHK